MGVLVSERERCERLYHDNPKDWDERKYHNRLKRQRQWIKSKATKVAEKLKRKESISQSGIIRVKISEKLFYKIFDFKFFSRV